MSRPPLVSAADTGGAFFVDTASAETAGRSPLHVHEHSDEFVLVLEGALRITVGDDVHELGPGQSVFLPRGVPHRFENEAGARWMIVGSGGYEAERAALNEGFASGRSPRAVYESLPGLRFLAD